MFISSLLMLHHLILYTPVLAETSGFPKGLGILWSKRVGTWWHPLWEFWGDIPSVGLCAPCFSSARWGLDREALEWDVLRLLHVQHMVGLGVSKAQPEVTGSLLACTKTEVPASISPPQGTGRVSGSFPCFLQVCWQFQIPQRA